MFTLEQIKAAHAKTKSGADFPSYIREIKTFGVTFYETFVTDGHTDYYGYNDFKTSTLTKYAALHIADECDTIRFKAGLKEHQLGNTDYANFTEMSAASGIEKWVVEMEKMTCAYYDRKGNEILIEKIPQ